MALPRIRQRRQLTLTGSLFLTHLLLLSLVLGAAAALWFALLDRKIDELYTERVLGIGRTVAALPEVRAALLSPDPAAAIAPRAADLTEASGAQYIVVADTEGIRHSHVNPDLIGKPVSTPPGAVLEGREWTGIQEGTLGRTVRAKVPVRDGAGTVIGYVSVGILQSRVEAASAELLPAVLGTVAASLAAGAAGAFVLSQRVRAKTHGLEPADITALLEGREALLHAVREGVLALDAEERVILANTPARAMLGLPDDCVGRGLAELGLDSRLHDVFSGADPGSDRIVLVGSRVLVCNRMPVRLRGRPEGAVVTLRDRTELERLSGELDGARTLTRGLRAQSHEFANRIHTLAGMLELGAVEEARAFLEELSSAHTAASTEISERIGDTALAALVLAKSAQAAECGAELRLSPLTDTRGALPPRLRADLLLVVGNLVDNALDSVASEGPGGWVELLVLNHRRATGGPPHDLVEVRVTDSGPGVNPALTAEIFTSGFTTKVARDGGPRGLGLALVRQACERRGGGVTVESPADGAATFTAYLPVVEATEEVGRP